MTYIKLVLKQTLKNCVQVYTANHLLSITAGTPSVQLKFGWMTMLSITTQPDQEPGENSLESKY